MRKLPKKIIQKYGITKKAWAVFRGKKARKARGGRKMARRKKHYGRKSAAGSGLATLLYAAVYGAARPYALKGASYAGMDKLPFGSYNANVALGGAATILPMLVKGKVVKDVSKVVQIFEVANAAGKASGSVTSVDTSAYTSY